MRRAGFPHGYALALAVVLLANVLRDISTTMPHQLSDETAFLLSAKYFLQWDLVFSLGYVPVPGLVFLKLASYVAASDDYYVVAKVLNAFLLTFAAVPAYLVARRVMPSAQAGVASVLVAVTPPTIYGAYFTPEATYIFMFWLFSAVSLAALDDLAGRVTTTTRVAAPERHALAMAAGALGGIAFLVKPHAAALGMAYVASAIVLTLLAAAHPDDRTGSRGRGWFPLGLAALDIAAFTAAAVFTVLIVGRVLAGSWLAAFDVKLYSTLVSHSTQTAWRSMNVGAIGTLVMLHVVAIVAALALPAAAAVPQAVWSRLPAYLGRTRIGPAPADSSTRVVTVFALTTLLLLVVMTAKATVDFHAIYGRSNVLDRLNARYYSFALPLLVFIAAGAAGKLTLQTKSRSMHAIAGVATTALAVACMLVTQRNTFTFIDAPDLTFLSLGYGTVVPVAVLVLLVALSNVAVSARSWLILTSWGLMSLLNVWLAGSLQQHQDRPHIGDRAVLALKGLFDQPELDRGIIVAGRNSVAAARVAFGLASRSPVVATPADMRARMGAETRWVLLLGDRSGTVLDAPVVQAGDSSIYVTNRKPQPAHDGEARNTYSFAAAAPSAPTAYPAHDPEPWGIWLTGTNSHIAFPKALPARGRLTVRANVLEPKRQSPVTIRVCGASHELELTASLADYAIDYACERPVDGIDFTGMHPLSPQSIRLSDDARELSLALAAIRSASR